MNTQLRKGLLAAAMTVLLGAAFAGSAFASSWGTGDLTNLKSYLSSNKVDATLVSNSQLSGSYYFTPLAYEADYTDKLVSGSKVLFTNTSLSTQFGQVTDKAYAASTVSFVDTVGSKSYNIVTSGAVDVYKLNKAWTLSNGVTLSAGTFIIGLNDSYSTTCQGDWDDFIVAASKTSPTPVPAAVWMLGSGLFGLMGIRRALKAGNNA